MTGLVVVLIILSFLSMSEHPKVGLALSAIAFIAVTVDLIV